MLELKIQIQFNSFCLQFDDKRIEKIIRKSAFDNKKKKAGLKFNPELVLTGVRTTGPRSIDSEPFSASNFLTFNNFGHVENDH